MAVLQAEDVPAEDVKNDRAINTEILESPERSRTARVYQKKIKGILHGFMREAAASTKTVPDAAALIVHSGNIAQTGGDLADADDRFRKAIDFIEGGTKNPYLSFAVAALPLVLQVLRNHEKDIEQVRPVREMRLPFFKKTIKLRFRIRLKNRHLRNMTMPPSLLTHRIFDNPNIRESLEKEGIEVAPYPF